MEPKNKWIPFKEIDWEDPKNNFFVIDTRDFHAGYHLEKNHPDYGTLKKYPDFFHTVEEVKTLITRYYETSGGKAEWRMFSLEGMDNWDMKYIRIWRSDLGFLVCNSKNRAFKKDDLLVPVNQEHLHTH